MASLKTHDWYPNTALNAFSQTVVVSYSMLTKAVSCTTAVQVMSEACGEPNYLCGAHALIRNTWGELAASQVVSGYFSMHRLLMTTAGSQSSISNHITSLIFVQCAYFELPLTTETISLFKTRGLLLMQNKNACQLPAHATTHASSVSWPSA